MQIDAFDGVFDDPIRKVREKIRAGEVVAHVRSNALSAQLLKAFGMDGEFGTYPARPATDARN